jgi:hypothetical protein
VTTDEPTIDLCWCDRFVWWYRTLTIPEIDVCQCGHPFREHTNGKGSCTGSVEVSTT